MRKSSDEEYGRDIAKLSSELQGELAQKRSHVFDIISNPTPVEVSLQE